MSARTFPQFLTEPDSLRLCRMQGNRVSKAQAKGANRTFLLSAMSIAYMLESKARQCPI